MSKLVEIAFRPIPQLASAASSRGALKAFGGRSFLLGTDGGGAIRGTDAKEKELTGFQFELSAIAKETLLRSA
jgi:hypothetical protein